MVTGRSNGRGNSRGGRNSSRGGRGGRNRNNQGSTKKRFKSTKRLHQFHPASLDNSRYEDANKIIQDMATELRANPEYVDSPELTTAIESVTPWVPVEPTEPTKTGEPPKYDEVEYEKWKSEMTVHRKKKENYRKLSNTAAATILSKYCTKEMQVQLRALEDFEGKVKLDPIEMLKRIKTLVSAGTTREHPTQRLLKNIELGFHPKMEDGQPLAHYLRIVETQLDTAIEFTGWDFLDSKTKETPTYKAVASKNIGDEEKETQRQSLLQAIREKFKVHVAYRGIPRGRFGNYQKHLEEAYAVQGIDLFPKDLDTMRETLSSDRFNKPSQEYLDAVKAKNQRNREAHRSRTFDHEKKIEGLPAAVFYQQKQEGEACFACGNPDHKLYKCKVKNQIPREQWAINKFNAHKKDFMKQYCQHLSQPAQATAAVPNTVPQLQQQQQSAMSDTASHRSGFTPIPTQLQAHANQFQQHQTSQEQSRPPSTTQEFRFMPQHTQVKLDLMAAPLVPQVDATQLAGVPSTDSEMEVKYLDSCSALHSTPYKELLSNVRPAEQPVNMGTNAGITQLTEHGELAGMKKVYYNPDGIATIQSMGLIVDALKERDDGAFMYMDTRYDDAIMIVYPQAGLCERYGRLENGLYGRKHHADLLEQIRSYRSAQQAHVQTVYGNIEGYPKRRVAEAIRAREFYHSLGHPSLRAYRDMVRAGQIRDCPITLQAIDDAEAIFGPDLAALKGKLVKKKPPPVTASFHAVPDELVAPHKTLPATMDVMYVCEQPFLVFHDKTIRDNVVEALPSRGQKSFYKALDEAFEYYGGHGFTIGEINCDREFKSLLDPVKNDLQITLDYGPAQEHANTAERFIRTIGERIRAYWHSTPFLVMPKKMIEELVNRVSFDLKIFPHAQGMSTTYSPRQIVTGRTISYKDLRYQFGSYCVGSNSPPTKNNPEPRGLDCIYMRPELEGVRGSHVLYDLTSHKIITRQYVWVLPMPPAVVEVVQKKAYSAGMKPLRFHNRKKVEILPVGLPAGVTGDNNQSNEHLLQHMGVDLDWEDDDYVFPDELVAPELPDDIGNMPIEEALFPEAEGLPGLTPRESQAYDDDSSDDESVDGPPGLRWRKYVDSSDEESIGSDDDSEAEEPGWVDMFAKSRRIRREANADNPGIPTVPHTTARTGVPMAPTAPKATAASPQKPSLRRSQRIAAKKAMVQAPATVDEEPLDTKADDDPSTLFYETESAVHMAQYIAKANSNATETDPNYVPAMAQQFLLPKAVKKWGNRAKAAAHKEMDQLHNRGAFEPILPSQCSPSELKKAQNALTFVTEKRDGTIKGRTVYDGSGTRVWKDKNETRSPTVSGEGLILTCCIDAKEGRDVMSLDVPNAFIQTKLPDPKPGEDRVLMRIEGTLAEELLRIDPDRYLPYLVHEKGRPVLYVVVKKAQYGMLEASLLWYKKFKADLESIGFVFNPYDPCVANRMVNDKQQTIRFHVDDLMSSHLDPSVNKEFLKWCNDKYGTYGEVKATFGPKHDYLGMNFDFSEPGKVKIDMIEYLTKMLDSFPIDFAEMKPVASAAPADLFQLGTSELLSSDLAEVYHTYTAKLLFACKRARPDIQTLVAVLCTRVKSPTQDDWNKLIQGLKFIEQTLHDKLTLRVDDLRSMFWYSDASFAVHEKDYRSHTGGVMSFGRGAVISISSKQKLNARSSTDAELIGADDVMSPLLWTRLFLESQGIEVQENVLYQDNKSAIILSENGKGSSGKRTRALNIRFFFIHDQIKAGNLRVVYCPTADMRADYFTKPLQGKLFHEHRAFIMGFDL